MAKARESDDHLESMLDELRTTVRTLNDLHHPVYPADPDRIAAYEARVVELREAIRVRRGELVQASSASSAASSDA